MLSTTRAAKLAPISRLLNWLPNRWASLLPLIERFAFHLASGNRLFAIICLDLPLDTTAYPYHQFGVSSICRSHAKLGDG